MNMSYICLTRSLLIICMNFEVGSPSISRSNETLTTGVSGSASMGGKDMLGSSKFKTSTLGGVMSTLDLKKSLIAVAAAPIIWFIASDTALSFISSISSLSVSPVPPIIMSAIFATTSFWRTRTFRPVSPSTNSIVTTTFSPLKSFPTSPNFTSSTTGVVMLTSLPSIVDRAVAAAPMEMFPTSPIISLSMSVKLPPPLKVSFSFSLPSPFKRASNSS